jgi:2-polyprenyl-3-methyl-5-hydroxy-6-metoxy-1,4-benzoquinol methylase
MFPEDQPLRILDVGAGSGYVSAYLSKMGHDVTATDTSEEMLNQIIKLAAMENLDLQIIKDDIMNTNLHKASYDAIVMIDVLFCLPDVKKALHNCIDLLHPGGLLVILDGNYLLHLYSDEYSSRDAFYQMKNGRKESAEMLHLTEEEFLELSKIFRNSQINSTKRPK